MEGGRGKSALRLHHQLATDTVAPLLSLSSFTHGARWTKSWQCLRRSSSPLCTHVCTTVILLLFYFLASWQSLSHDHWCLSRASQRWTFYGFSNESHHSDEPGHEGLALQQMKQSQGLGTHFGSSRIRDVANLWPCNSSGRKWVPWGCWSVTPVSEGGCNSCDDSLNLMALSWALNPSTLIGGGESSGRWRLLPGQVGFTPFHAFWAHAVSIRRASKPGAW